MEEISGLKSLLRCRLCGLNGLHEMDILENSTPDGPNNPNALRQKIFRCVGIRVDRNDKLTTKICGNCVDKINEFVLFRQICAATNVQLRIALSIEADGVSSVDVFEETDAAIDLPIDHFSLDGEDMSTMAIRALDDENFANAEVNRRKTSKSNSEISNQAERTATTNNECSAWKTSEMRYKRVTRQSLNSESGVFGRDECTAQQKSQCAAIGTPIASTSLVDDESEYEEDDVDNASIDGIGMCSEDASAKKQRSASKKTITKHRRSNKVNCVAPNGGGCKEAFDTWQAMMYHVANYHGKGIKKKFECHLCKKSFSSRHKIQQHVASVHTGLKPFECPNRSCSKMFSHKGDIKRHIDSVHIGLKPFKCTNRSCSKSFARKYHLNAHISSVHFSLRPLKCPYRSCSKRFTQKGHLEEHINSVHTS